MRHPSMRHFLLAVVIITTSAFVGCGDGPEPDVPARLTPEMEQEILDQVEGTAAGEEGKS